jgi:hypothetical protein
MSPAPDARPRHLCEAHPSPFWVGERDPGAYREAIAKEGIVIVEIPPVGGTLLDLGILEGEIPAIAEVARHLRIQAAVGAADLNRQARERNAEIGEFELEVGRFLLTEEPHHGALHIHRLPLPPTPPDPQETDPSRTEVAMDVTHVPRRQSCLGQTCLQWQSDGELSPVDRELILQRLLQVDGCSAADQECTISPSKGQ